MALPTAASVLTSGLSAYPTIYFDRVALDTLYSNLSMYPALELKPMPDNAGVVMQIYDYTAMGANTTPATEGTPGAGQALTQNTGSITLSQFVDYVSISDKALKTAFVDTMSDAARELAYRGALSVDTVVSTAFDTAAAADSLARLDLTNGTFMTASQSRKADYGLRAVNVKPKANGLFMGIMPAVMSFDLVNDATAGGFIDLTKYAANTNQANLQGVGQGALHNVGKVGGVDWFESNSLPTDANFQGGGLIGYHAYIVGMNAFIGSSLSKTQLGQQNFSVKVNRYTEGLSPIDPAGLIGASAHYNFFFGLVKRPGGISAFRRIRAQATIG